MPRRPYRIPDTHGASSHVSTALRALGYRGRVVRQLGGNANMHWLLECDGSRLVLRRYHPHHIFDDLLYELRVIERVAALGWPVAKALGLPQRVGRHWWCLFEYVPGNPRRPRSVHSVRDELRTRGRLLAELHEGLSTLVDLGQRPQWLRREAILSARSDGPSVHRVIRDRMDPEQARIIIECADRAAARFAELGAEHLPAIVNHGDLVGNNVRFLRGKLSGIIDFDQTHLDHRIADFAWTWSASNDEFVSGYEEVTPLDHVERALLTPAFWSSVLDALRAKLLGEDLPPKVSLPHWVAMFERRSALTAI